MHLNFILFIESAGSENIHLQKFCAKMELEKPSENITNNSNEIKKMKKKITPKFLAIFGFVSIFTIALIRWGIVDSYIKAEFTKKLKLEPGTELFEIWTDMEKIPILIKFYFFNVTNPEKVLHGARPKLKELGPYVYQEIKKKIVLDANDETIKYRPKTYYFFRQDLSVGSVEDKVTIPNIPFIGLAKMAWDMSKEPMILSTLDDMLAGKGETVFHTNKVREYLFDGFSIANFMELLSLPITEMFDVKVPDRLKDGKFGFFNDKNGTTNDLWVVKTGKQNLKEFGKVVSVNGRTELDTWSGDCNKIDGTDGTIFPPFGNRNSVLKAFSQDLCRSIEMQFLGDGEFQGIPTLKYSFKDNLYGSSDLYPEKECFCENNYENCKLGGLIPLGECIGGAPVYASQPHFYKAHESFIKAVDGLNRDQDYKSIVELEPTVGLPLKGSLRLQFNVELQNYDFMPSFHSVPNVMFPIMWAEESATAPTEFLAPLKTLHSFLKILDSGTILIIGFGATLLFISLIWHAVNNKLHVKLLGRT